MKSPFAILLFFVVITLLSAERALTSTIKLPKGIITLDGEPAPKLTLSDMDGNQYQLSPSPGRWVFVHFWASWCGPCRREMPTIQTMSEHLNNSAFDIILVNTAETDDAVFNFLGIAAPALTTLMDYDGQVTERWQPRGLPASFFVDPTGKLRYIALGGRDWDKPDYLNFIKSLLSHKQNKP
ncbi:MAG: TlpA family protein disulfide reductase [Gammaproteobacteria bacterium]|nr:TlpA family protein disulfide reductase [Gammaproteobacteria bacterium]